MATQTENNKSPETYWYTSRSNIQDIFPTSRPASENRDWKRWFTNKNKSLEQQAQPYRIGPEYGVIATSWLGFQGYGVDIPRTISESVIGIYQIEKPTTPTISLEHAIDIFGEKEKERRKEYEKMV